ncbi:MAG: aromatic aminobenezylarsenical efflux permease ArsG family transporter [Bacteroidetes bacterium]|nr:aromatic aminobenezylarsenical efflux permease ArsG family transporter [Bacteroidota bacterium]
MHSLQSLLDNTTIPVVYAFLLGLMTAISPCPLATNITAIGYISKDIDNRVKIFINGLLYTLGRAISYTSLGLILYFGASKFHVARFFQIYGEKLLGPLLIIFGILLLNVIRIKLPGSGKWADKFQQVSGKNRSWSALFLGIIFALAFCPYSGVLYFGMLIPMTITSPSGLYLPLVFAVATGLPVIIIAWLLAYSISSIGSFYNKLRVFEKWFRIVVAALFIGVGIYYSIIFLL